MAPFFRHASTITLLLAVSAATPAAYADVWGYVDADGAAHVATEKLDERYQLFFKGTSNVDPSNAALYAGNAALDSLRQTAIYKRMVDHPNIARYQALIERNARARGIDTALVKAVIAVESAFEPAAVSPKGALGLMQVMPDTGARYGVAAEPETHAGAETPRPGRQSAHRHPVSARSAHALRQRPRARARRVQRRRAGGRALREPDPSVS